MAINRPPTVELRAAQEEAEGQQLSVGMQRHSGQDVSLAEARTAREANTHEYFMVSERREERSDEGREMKDRGGEVKVEVVGGSSV